MRRDAPYRGKRALDVGLALIAAAPTASLTLVVWLAVKLDDRGPVHFRQERVGRNGRTFLVVKFRTMHADLNNPAFPDAAAITRVGSVLRRTSLDELPQVWNVLRGDMSVVGPRPTLPYQVARYTEEQHRRHAVRPGLTGLAQVSGRNVMPWAERIAIDLQYVRDQSLLLDVKILIKSFVVVTLGAGVEGHPTDDPLALPDPVPGPAAEGHRAS